MNDLINMSLGDAGLTAVLGYLVVFVGLALLMCVVMLVGKVMKTEAKPAPSPASTPEKTPEPAPGSARRTQAIRHRSKGCRHDNGHSCRQLGQTPERTPLYFH